jgi:hypothetical protein
VKGVLTTWELKKVDGSCRAWQEARLQGGEKKSQARNRKIKPVRFNILEKVFLFNRYLMKTKHSLNGEDIALRLELLIKQTPEKTWSALGQRLGLPEDISSQGKIKRCRKLIDRLKQGTLLSQLNVCADYVDVDLEYLLFGRFSINVE